MPLSEVVRLMVTRRAFATALSLAVLAGLAVSGGQFFQWRFLTRGLWWHAHPYSLSALPRAPFMRVTVKGLGDQSRALKSGSMAQGLQQRVIDRRRDGGRRLGSRDECALKLTRDAVWARVESVSTPIILVLGRRARR